MSLRLALIVLAVLMFGTEAAARTVYVNDMLRVGVRTEPDSSLSPIAIVTTGQALEVLDSGNGYIKIRGPNGVEGWINDAYATEEIPARRRIADLKEERERLAAEVERLNAANEAVREESARLASEVEALSAENASLRSRLDSNYAAVVAREAYRWAIYAALMLGTLALGFLFGVRWFRQRVAARYGGLTI